METDTLRVLLLLDYNTRVVVIGTVLLGIAGGVIGTFMLLRKRALLADAVSHATLPGIGIAFLALTAAGGSGKSLPWLLFGALLGGLAGMGAVLAIRSHSRIKEDAALAIVLSVFFGVGVSLLVLIQQLNRGHAAGLDTFIYGKAAAMLRGDAILIATAAAGVVGASLLLFKEFAAVCFDEAYAASLGWPVRALDALMMGLVVAVTVIGLQSVGLVLVIALLIIPPAAARFWTHRLGTMATVAAGIGGASAWCGTWLSALHPRMPTGALIVVSAGVCFVASLLFGIERGVVRHLARHLRMRRNVARQHLLRALYEWNEATGQVAPGAGSALRAGMPARALAEARAWTAGELRAAMRPALSAGLVRTGPGGAVQLTEAGYREAQSVVRNHRLWETYLITFADVAPAHVDRSADQIEHVLGVPMVARLERLLDAQRARVPPNPHARDGAGEAP